LKNCIDDLDIETGSFLEEEISGRMADKGVKGLGSTWESFCPKSVDMFWICRIFSGLISFYLEQLSFPSG
jgi:hypothetical protein